MRLDDTTQPVPLASKSTNLYFYVPPGQTQSWISAYLAKGQNEGGVYLTFSKSVDGAADIYDLLYADREEIGKLVPGLVWQINADGKVWIVAPTIQLGDLNLPENRQRVWSYLADQANSMVNAFRHRLIRIEKERATQ